MTTSKTQSAPDFLTPEEQAADKDAQEWQTVSEEDVEETKFTFDNWGEQFTGTYVGMRLIDGTEGKFTQFRFTHDGFHYFINAGWSLINGMANVRKGQLVRITYVTDRDTGQPTPMKIMRVDVSKLRRAASNPRHITPE